MNFYVENKSLLFVKKAFEAVQKNTKEEINKGFIINYKGGFSKKTYNFFKKKTIYDVEYVMKGVKGLKKALRCLNMNKNPISLTLLIDKEISSKNKKLLLKAKKTIKIIDNSNISENILFYKSCNKIIYKTSLEDNILDIDIMHIYKFFEPELQCKFSSCLGKNYYVDRNGIVHFCPLHLSESIVGSISSDEKFMDNDLFISVLKKAIEKRNTCKRECKYFDYCLGACPMENGCCDFPELFKKNTKYIDDIIHNNKDLTNENLLVAKIIIKDAVYEN